MCESFFATLECELIEQRPRFTTRPEAKMAVFDFIEGSHRGVQPRGDTPASGR